MPAALEIARLEALCFENPWSPAQVESTLASSFARAYFVSTDGAAAIAGRINTPENALGFAVLLWGGADGVIEVLRIGTVPDRRRRGLAAALLAAVEEDGRKANMERLILEVSASNQAALRLYLKAGFREIHRRRDYYSDGADAVVMEKAL